jgi:hypothetical protein
MAMEGLLDLVFAGFRYLKAIPVQREWQTETLSGYDNGAALTLGIGIEQLHSATLPDNTATPGDVHERN